MRVCGRFAGGCNFRSLKPVAYSESSQASKMEFIAKNSQRFKQSTIYILDGWLGSEYATENHPKPKSDCSVENSWKVEFN